jgi:ElaB/YqjD/DUF883 family membrane-anchored ribosome-binding protein
MPTTTDTRSAAKSMELGAEQVGQRADQALQTARRAADGAIDALQHKVDDLNESIPGALGRAAARVDEITRRGIERARDTSSHLREEVTRAGDRTVAYIKDEPVKSVLIAAATGAAVAALVTLLAQSRSRRGL